MISGNTVVIQGPREYFSEIILEVTAQNKIELKTKAHHPCNFSIFNFIFSTVEATQSYMGLH